MVLVVAPHDVAPQGERIVLFQQHHLQVRAGARGRAGDDEDTGLGDVRHVLANELIEGIEFLVDGQPPTG